MTSGYRSRAAAAAVGRPLRLASSSEGGGGDGTGGGGGGGIATEARASPSVGLRWAVGGERSPDCDAARLLLGRCDATRCKNSSRAPHVDEGRTVSSCGDAHFVQLNDIYDSDSAAIYSHSEPRCVLC